MKFFIKYGTGAGDFDFSGTLEEAKAKADAGSAYTQRDYYIENENGEEICRRNWCGVPYDPEVTEETEDEVIQFGSFGHYTAWNET